MSCLRALIRFGLPRRRYLRTVLEAFVVLELSRFDAVFPIELKLVIDRSEFRMETVTLLQSIHRLS